MKLRAWMEMYLYRGRNKNKKKEKNKKNATTTEVLSTRGSVPPTLAATEKVLEEDNVIYNMNSNASAYDDDDRRNRNVEVCYESLDEDQARGRCRRTINETVGGRQHQQQQPQRGNRNETEPAMTAMAGTGTTAVIGQMHGSSHDVRRTPLLGIRSAYSRGTSLNEQTDGGAGDSDVASVRSALYTSLSSVLGTAGPPSSQACMSPMTRSKIKTNPWYQTPPPRTPSASTSASSTLTNDRRKPFRSGSTSSDFSAMDDSLTSDSSMVPSSSNTSTLDSVYRTPLVPRYEQVDHKISTEDIIRDSGYISQDSKYPSLKKVRERNDAYDEHDTDDSGTLMEKEWSSPEVECCDIIPKKLTGSVEIDEAYSEVSSLPSESPEDEHFPEFQKPSREINRSSEEPGKCDGKRTIRDICGSLEEKVQRLRFERLLVEEKIKEAREEERIRCEQKMKFQKEMIVHRRQILLRTLQNIRFKLEDQGQRLQDAYNCTLGMQLKVRRNNQSVPTCGTPTAACSVLTSSSNIPSLN